MQNLNELQAGGGAFQPEENLGAQIGNRQVGEYVVTNEDYGLITISGAEGRLNAAAVLKTDEKPAPQVTSRQGQLFRPAPAAPELGQRAQNTINLEVRNPETGRMAWLEWLVDEATMKALRDKCAKVKSSSVIISGEFKMQGFNTRRRDSHNPDHPGTIRITAVSGVVAEPKHFSAKGLL